MFYFRFINIDKVLRVVLIKEVKFGGNYYREDEFGKKDIIRILFIIEFFLRGYLFFVYKYRDKRKNLLIIN